MRRLDEENDTSLWLGTALIDIRRINNGFREVI
jgi:hypothetical protein